MTAIVASEKDVEEKKAPPGAATQHSLEFAAKGKPGLINES